MNQGKISCCPAAPENARLGAVTLFIGLVWFSTEWNTHFHCCVIDDVFSAEYEALQFNEAAITASRNAA